MNPQKTLQILSERLGLTDEQKAKLLPLLQGQGDQLKALMHDESLSRDIKREKIHSLMQSTHEQIRALLTPEQQEKFNNMRHREHSGPPANNPPPPPPGPPPGE